ncbi:hypothetical protein [Lentzea aerocolonigenes]|uniref:hypothetical protein n=1 Tax=Lentzea aerocolonigenes TaxID=68170 RepID=UPI000696C73D|nr:hypothetical protein [Lentzea aerocolonigenes]
MAMSDELRVLRDTSGDPAFRALLDDVITGRKSLRQAASTDVFGQGVEARVAKGLDVLSSMSEEDFDALAERGEQALTPPPPKPVARRPMAPPRADDDDDYEVEVMEP